MLKEVHTMYGIMTALPQAPGNVEGSINFSDINWWPLTLIVLALIAAYCFHRKNGDPIIGAVVILTVFVIICDIQQQKSPVSGFSFVKHNDFTITVPTASIPWWIYDLVLVIYFIVQGYRARNYTDDDRHPRLSEASPALYLIPAAIIVVSAVIYGLVVPYVS